MLLLLFVALGSSTFNLYQVDDDRVVCNDGSPYQFYFSPGKETNWFDFVLVLLFFFLFYLLSARLVFFEGGAWCFDPFSCAERMKQSPYLMSSKSLSQTSDFGGVLGSDNALFGSWSKVFLHYCTSDDFSGLQNASKTNPFSFQGSLVIEAVLNVLSLKFKLKNDATTTVVLAGSSAGGEALYANADRVSVHLLSRARVVAIDDSGYFQYSTPFLSRSNCTDANTCTEAQGIEKGAEYWNAQVNEQCAKFHSQRWNCLMGPSVLKHMLTKTFVFNYLLVKVLFFENVMFFFDFLFLDLMLLNLVTMDWGNHHHHLKFDMR
jgi:hypothetical protein